MGYTMLVVLRNEAGRQREAVVFNIEDAVRFCVQYPDFGAFLYPSYEGEEVDEVGFIALFYDTMDARVGI